MKQQMERWAEHTGVELMLWVHVRCQYQSVPCTSPPVTYSKPPVSTRLLSRAQLWWGAFSGISQMFLLLSQPPCSCPAPHSSPLWLFGAWAALTGS